MSDTEKNFPASEKKDAGKKKDGKRDKKEKGYIMFDADGSDEDLVAGEEMKSPSKMRKGKSFKFGPKKDIFMKGKDKEEKKDKEGKKEEKERRKGEKEKKHKLKGKKKLKHHELQKPAVPATYEKPIFGVPLSLAVERSRSHDGIQLPALFRECVDYIEEHGLFCEGIYRISGVKSKVQHLKDSYNRNDPVYLPEHEPNIVAGLLKQFLRELPEPVLTNALIPRFEEASTIRNERRRIESFRKLIQELPECNKLLLSWMIVHMTHVIERQRENKMTLQNVSIVLSPTMQISHRVLNVLFSHTKHLFKDTVIKRYIPPLKPATSKWSLELPDNPQALQEELLKQESLLNQLHQELAGKADPEKEEMIWEVQRVCTQLKRKIKLATRGQDTLERKRKDRDEHSKKNVVLEDEEMCLDLRQLPEHETLRLELREAPENVPPEPEVNTQLPKDTDTETMETKGQPNVTLKELANQSKVKVENADEETEITDNKDIEPVEVGEKQTEDDVLEQTVTGKDLDTKTSHEDEIAVTEDNEIKKESDRTEVNSDQPIGTGVTNEIVEEPIKTVVTVNDEPIRAEESNEPMKTVDTTDGVSVSATMDENEGETSETHDVTPEEIRADLKEKQAMMFQEDTTDSELGKSTEDIQAESDESEDEFEHSLEEILERQSVDESDREGVDQEICEESTQPLRPVDTISPTMLETVATESVTPVPMETVESPQPTVTPIPQLVEEEVKPETQKEEISEAITDEQRDDVSSDGQKGEESTDESFDEEEYQLLLEEEFALRLEEEEQLAIENELRTKIETEHNEIDRLHQEIAELQYLRQDSDLEEMSSSSDSSYESEDEEDLQDILAQLLKENEELESSNWEMCQKIHEERMICLDVKVQIGLLQHKQLQSSVGSETFLEKDSLIEFD